MNPKLKLTANAMEVLRRRYLQKDGRGRVKETPEQMFRRVAHHVAQAENRFGPSKYAEEWESIFFDAMTRLEFLPNSPTLMNAGGPLGQLAACFVLPVEDSMESIFDAVKNTALIHQSGGGTGFSFSHLRPARDVVRSTHGISSGPVSFMRVFDAATEAVKQGGARRGANMGILRVDHPDILDFIQSKRNGDFLNFNLSVGVTDAFMKALRAGKNYDLVNPRTHEKVKSISAKKVFDLICECAWENGDPGLVFLDRIEASNPTPEIGALESTNPCVTGDSLIYTEAGLKRVKDLFEQNQKLKVTIDSRRNAEHIFLNGGKIFKTGKKKIYQLMTIEGYSLRLTFDHKIMTERGWVAAKDLVEGDEIHILNRKGGFGNKGTLEEGKILGWLVGDGTLKRDRAVLSFFGGEKQGLAPHFAEIVNQTVQGLQKYKRDYPVGVVEIKNRNESRVSSKRLLRLVEEYDLLMNKHMISDQILSAGEAFQRGFLLALFTADGSVQGTRVKGVSVRLAQSNLEVLQKVQQMLLNFGIASKIYKNRRSEMLRSMPDGKGGFQKYLCKAQHELIITKGNLAQFKNEIGFLDERKNKKLEEYFAEAKRDSYRETFNATFRELIEMGEEDVFDLTEPLTHSFVANGIVVHNCGEQPLLAYESCNLGSINLAKLVTNGRFDFNRLRRLVETGVRFLDDVIEVNHYPVLEIRAMTLANRKIGLGVMGFADALIQMGIPYNSEKALKFGESVMKFVQDESKRVSRELARERGAFPNFERSRYAENGAEPLRNATTTTVAPTGTLSVIAGCSSGIEPLFAISFWRNILEGSKLLDANPYFERAAKAGKFFSPRLMKQIAARGSCQGVKEVPKPVQRIFLTTFDLSAQDHIRMQAAFQKYTDNAVSKTVNLPENATKDDVRKVYLLSYQLGCKGVTIFRNRSRTEQVLNLARE